MDPLAFLIVALATFRLSHMVALERGPWHVFDRLRERLGATQDVRTGAWTPTNGLVELILCPLCLSVWVGALLVGLWLLVPVLQVAVAAIAVSGLSCALELGLARK